MRRFLFAGLLALMAAGTFADALPLDWFRKRNGLTDAQVDDIFEKNPNAKLRLTRGKWMELKYRLHRFDNIRDWLNMQIEGRLGDEILRVSDTNEVLTAEIRQLATDVARWKDTAEAAEDDARVLREIEKKASRTDKNLAKIIKTLEQAKKKASTPEEAELYELLANVLQGIRPNLGE